MIDNEHSSGRLSNTLPYYPDTLDLRVAAKLQRHNRRPLLDLAPAEHPLARDYRQGISLSRAQDIAERALHHDH